MIGARADHPNCMYQWLDWASSPEVQEQVAEWDGVAPANPEACGRDRLRPQFCTAYHVGDRAYLSKIIFARLPVGDLRRRQVRAPTTPTGTAPGGWRGGEPSRREGHETASRRELVRRAPGRPRRARVSFERPGLPPDPGRSFQLSSVSLGFAGQALTRAARLRTGCGMIRSAGTQSSHANTRESSGSRPTCALGRGHFLWHTTQASP